MSIKIRPEIFRKAAEKLQCCDAWSGNSYCCEALESVNANEAERYLFIETFLPEFIAYTGTPWWTSSGFNVQKDVTRYFTARILALLLCEQIALDMNRKSK